MRKPEGAGGCGWFPHSPQAVQKGGLLTRPTPARQDSPFRGQGRKGDAPFERFTFYVSRFTHLQNKAGGLFQQLAKGRSGNQTAGQRLYGHSPITTEKD